MVIQRTDPLGFCRPKDFASRKRCPMFCWLRHRGEAGVDSLVGKMWQAHENRVTKSTERRR